MKLLYTLFFLFFIGIPVLQVDAQLKINSENLSDYRLSFLADNLTSDYICFYDQGNQKIVRLDLGQVFTEPVHVLIRKQSDTWSGKVWSCQQTEPLEWNSEVKTLLADNSSDWPDADYQQVILKPLHVTSITSSWGRIKYLFNSN